MALCPTCGKDFAQPRGYRKTYCSIECANKRDCPERVGDPNTAAARKMRRTVKCRERRLRHAQTWDGITDEEILARDGWRCRLPKCLYPSRKINRRYKYPDKRSPGVDHIVPLSLGGDDTAVNKRAAHHGCNIARGNRMGDEQLPLIGSLREPPRTPVVAGAPNRCACGQEAAPRRKYCEDCNPVARRRKEQAAHAEVQRQENLRLSEQVRTMRATGMKWQDISDALGLSGPGRAYQLAYKYGSGQSGPHQKIPAAWTMKARAAAARLGKADAA